VPAATPVTKPVDEFIVATPVLTDFQTPPVVVLDNAVVLATHTLVVPVIAAITGNAFTVKFRVAVLSQPCALVAIKLYVPEVVILDPFHI
jgi:hypothetical protein